MFKSKFHNSYIKFEVGGIKKLLLRFAKLDVIG